MPLITLITQNPILTGICKVDQTEKGWFITYIDRDPETIERQKVQFVA